MLLLALATGEVDGPSVRRGLAGAYTPELVYGAIGRDERWGRLGIAAGGIVFSVVGTFLIRAALQYDLQEARGLGGALQTLANQPLGP